LNVVAWIRQRHLTTNATFFRDSGIQVSIDYDVEANIDRGVELINRTNQLNFTKVRLAEDPEAARDELRPLLQNYDIQAGLIKR
jgi:predicted enzyme involved in methoxymalonyl-ACP biosynthesis